MPRGVFLLLSLAALPGCGIGFQTALGWSTNEGTVRKTVRKEVRIETAPANAAITRRSDAGEVQLGASPLVDTVEYQVDETRTSPSAIGLLVGSVAELATGLGAWRLGRGEEKCFADGECYRTEEPSDAMLGISGTLIAFGVIDLIVFASHAWGDDEVDTKPVDPPSHAYLARKEGFRDAGRNFELDGSERVLLALDPLPQAPAAQVAPVAQVVPPQPAKPAAKTWVIAVMELQASEAQLAELAIDPTLIKSVADQVRVFVAGRGYRTVDRGSQRAAFEKQIEEVKLESYKDCYDDACQIELGKALAASHIVRASIRRFGSKCVLNGELVDLAAEVVTRGASSTGDCQAEGFLTMSEEVANQLLP